ncbi:S1/P1 nuclease [Chromobacterium haemolyticum]|nr:S1/P1 nuclease [Chromobacterium haemolyticum]
MKKLTLAMLLSAAFALPSAQALAWGQEGHRITGYIAQQLLSPQAKAAVNQLIPNADFAQLALYMDQHKQELKQQLPGSDQWHYNDEPVCDGVEEDDCPSGNCASNQIARYSKVLADKSASKSARAQALTFLLHMIGDIHQPLHAADNHDRGGNDVRVRLAGGSKVSNLHSVWDTALVQQALNGANEQSWAAQDLKYYARNIAGWQSGRSMTGSRNPTSTRAARCTARCPTSAAAARPATWPTWTAPTRPQALSWSNSNWPRPARASPW